MSVPPLLFQHLEVREDTRVKYMQMYAGCGVSMGRKGQGRGGGIGKGEVATCGLWSELCEEPTFL